MHKPSTSCNHKDPPPSWERFLMEQRRSQLWNETKQRQSVIRMTTTWADLERYLRTMSLSDREIASFRHLYQELDVRRANVICSLAYFRVSTANNHHHYQHESQQQQRHDALENLAQFLTDPNVSHQVKLFSLRLIPVLSEPCQSNEETTTTTFHQEVLNYCLNRSSTTKYNNNDDRYTDLVQELRKACQNEINQQQRVAVILDPLAVSLSNDVVWEVIRNYLLANRVPTQELPALEVAYRRGVRHEVILASVSFLRLESQRKKRKERECDDHSSQVNAEDSERGDCNEDADNARHGRAIANIAAYLADPVPLDSAKIACLQYLWNAKHSGDRNDEDTMFWMSALSFCVDSSADTDPFLDGNDLRMALLWEIRAVALHGVEEHRKRQEELLAPALFAASIITETATWVKNGLQRSSTVVNHGLERSSRFIVEHTEPSTCKWWDSNNDGDHENRIPEWTSALRRATSQTRLSSARTVGTLRDASARRVREQLSSPEQSNHRWFPRKVEHRALVLGVGELTLATLGAAAMIGEAVAVTTGSIAQSAAQATAHVIGHKYGTTAGQVVRDISDTAGNVLRTTGNLAMFTSRGTSVAKSIAKNAGKQHVQDKQQQHTNNKTASYLRRDESDCTAHFPRTRAVSVCKWKSQDDDDDCNQNDTDSETEINGDDDDPTIFSEHNQSPIIIRI